MSPEQIAEIIAEGRLHMNFCVEVYNMQVGQGRFFLHEHPSGASSLKPPGVVSLLQRKSVYKVRGDMCAHNKILTDAEGSAPAYKPTGWMSNPKHILNQLNKLRTNSGSIHDHRHVSLEGGLAAKAAIYPEKLSLAILRGLRKEFL